LGYVVTGSVVISIPAHSSTAEFLFSTFLFQTSRIT